MDREKYEYKYRCTIVSLTILSKNDFFTYSEIVFTMQSVRDTRLLLSKLGEKFLNI